jgi:hypothetical protein
MWRKSDNNYPTFGDSRNLQIALGLGRSIKSRSCKTSGSPTSAQRLADQVRQGLLSRLAKSNWI